ncbi:MAG TPA: alpha-amylase family glycosyl hydrolase [Bacteroidota bacterium]|nr:alpha-amylase family glycosyl hydrolase [Bacteroidota bacterium]
MVATPNPKGARPNPMSIPQADLSKAPLGGTIVPGGATFRIWAPRANAVYLSGDFNQWTQNPKSLLKAIGGGHWAGFISSLKDGDEYQFYVKGAGTEGFKRDPRARVLSYQPAFPESHSVLRDPAQFPWHETGFRPPPFNEMIIYQFHVGTYSIGSGRREGSFLDVIGKIPYLAALGVNAIEALPIQEFETQFSMGYNGSDYFSPENLYAVSDETELWGYLQALNTVLLQASQLPYGGTAVLRGADNQLRALIDVCHVYGIAVLLDVVYNHAGGGFDDSSIWFLDRMPYGNANDSLYFTDQGWAGGEVFAYWNADVRQFLVDNAMFFYDEYRIDGFRFDEVSVMDRFGGWQTCQEITGALRAKKPEAIQIAEYWPVNAAVVQGASGGGAGFDATWHDGLRGAVRSAIAQAASGASAPLDLDSIAGALVDTGLPERWRAVTCLENHDLVYAGREPRIAKLADPGNARSWYARSRSRLALGLLMTAPGIPMIFMGEEFLEDKQWSDTPSPSNLIWWQGLGGPDRTMSDFLHFTQDLIRLRRKYGALCAEGCSIIHVHNENRVLAFQRWVEGVGADVVIVATLSETNWYDYQVGFPCGGRWREAFNSDAYDNWPNPSVTGNAGSVEASGPPLHGLPNSASVTIPANGFVVFERPG